MVSAAVVDLLEVESSWKGTATELLLELSGLDSVHETDKKWPKKLMRGLNLLFCSDRATPHIFTYRLVISNSDGQCRCS